MRPGDSLSVRFEIVSGRRSRSKPDRGLVSSRLEVLNQRDEVVMTMRTTLLVQAPAIRDPAAGRKLHVTVAHPACRARTHRSISATPGATSPDPCDFVARNVLGSDPKTGDFGV